jgi:DNA-binding IclR family transcriptional regulator
MDRALVAISVALEIGDVIPGTATGAARVLQQYRARVRAVLRHCPEHRQAVRSRPEPDRLRRPPQYRACLIDRS